MERFWMVIKHPQQSHSGNAVGTKRHASSNEAMTEAQRLAEKEPGNAFFVVDFHTYCKATVNPPQFYSATEQPNDPK